MPVIAGLDPAIQERRMNAADFVRPLDRRVKPGNDTLKFRRKSSMRQVDVFADLYLRSSHLRSSLLFCVQRRSIFHLRVRVPLLFIFSPNAHAPRQA
jgi:hypothetical protein